MIYAADIDKLISQWTERMGDYAHPSAYREALSDCIYDLNQLVMKSFEEEIDAFETFNEQIKRDFHLPDLDEEAA